MEKIDIWSGEPSEKVPDRICEQCRKRKTASADVRHCPRCLEALQARRGPAGVSNRQHLDHPSGAFHDKEDD